MRWLLVLLGLMMFCAVANAQQQEDKMIDRIMRPNMNLQNSAQDKKFLAVEGTSAEKKFETSEFNSGAAAETKNFLGLKSFLSKTFGTGKFARAEAAANAKANAEIAFTQTAFATRNSSLVRSSAYQNKSEPVRDYPDQRPFMAKGTRQKIFDQQRKEKPMTIDEVRELLNKNR